MKQYLFMKQNTTDEGQAFAYESRPQRVVFGSGTLEHIGEALERLQVQRPLVVTVPQQRDHAERVAAILRGVESAIFDQARMHTPTDVTELALQTLATHAGDCVIAIGGGSSIGLSKAVAYRTGLPQIVVPTTYAGSEMTPILGQTENGLKTTLSDARVLPGTVIYDVDLTLTLPVAISASSGMNALAHAVEALYARDRNPIISLLAADAIEALGGALPRIIANPMDRAARAEALRGAWLCGMALGSVGMALHHKLCHTLGGSFELPHAETHSVMLPHVAAFNGQATAPLLAPICDALGDEAPGMALHRLALAIGAPVSLANIGMKEADLDKAAEIAMANFYWNPRPFMQADIRALLDDAYFGRPPRG